MIQKKSLILIILAVLIAGILIGSYKNQDTKNTNIPSDTSAEAGFARDMGDHHQQAVDMAFIIRDKSTDSMIRVLAFDIINTQATQRGIMMGWLEQWELPQTTTRTALAWMHNDAHQSGHSELMPGMANTNELEKLRTLSDKEAEILFLQLMIRHHEGGIDMARGVIKLSNRSEVKRLAQSMVNSQQAEVELMQDMLKKRGGTI